jgi:hypothetical protein
MGQRRVPDIAPRKSHSRKTKKRLQIKAAMLAARAARKKGKGRKK